MDRKLMVFLGLLIIVSLVLAACGGVGPAASGDEGMSDTNSQGNSENADGGAGDSVNPNDGANGDCPDCNNDAGAGSEDADAGGEDDVDSLDDFVPEAVGPRPIEIKTADGRTLEGLYFPSRFPNAPVTVLMHWAKGDMHDWDVIGPWLQNRPDELAAALPGDLPPLPEDVSFGVVTFNFGGYGGSPPGDSRESLLKDAASAALFAANLPGIDPMHISMMGASIGADGAVDACYEVNMQTEVPARCVGAFSLSPGNYITNQYAYNEAATALDEDGVPVVCLAAESDYDSPVLCGQVGGALGKGVIYTGSHHGMDLLGNPQTPLTPADAGYPFQVVAEFFVNIWEQWPSLTD